MVIGDVYRIEDYLKELDPELRLEFNYELEQYEVWHKDYFVMYWPRPLDYRLVVHLRKINLRRGNYDPFREIDEHNEKLEKNMEKNRLDHIEQVVKYYQPKLRNEIDGIDMKTVF